MKKHLYLWIIIFILFLTLVSCGETKEKDTDIDYDLTVMGPQMVYATVNDMLTNPNKYLNKTIKIVGQFSVFKDDTTNKEYPSIIIQDATLCCANGIEIVLRGDPKYPDGYPTLNTYITIVGRYETYTEGKDLYCHLVDVDII